MTSKLFCNFNRPRMSCTALLLHGHLCLSVLTPNTISCNSSRTAEIVAHGLSFLIQKNVDLRNAFFHLQADNASKECKNQCLLRHLGVQVALKKLKGAQMSFLTSGHSHEDIDAMFALLRSWLQRTPEIHTPSDFRDRLQAFFDDPSHRPYEKFREVVMMSRFRDWISSIGLALHDTNFQMFFGKDMERFLSIVVFESSLEYALEEELLGDLCGSCPSERHRWPWGTACFSHGKVGGYWMLVYLITLALHCPNPFTKMQHGSI